MTERSRGDLGARLTETLVLKGVAGAGLTPACRGGIGRFSAGTSGGLNAAQSVLHEIQAHTGEEQADDNTLIVAKCR